MEKLRADLVQRSVDSQTDISLVRKALQILEDGGIQNLEAKKYLSDREARVYAGNLSRTSLWQWRKKGLTNHPVGGRILYLASDIDNFIEGKNK